MARTEGILFRNRSESEELFGSSLLATRNTHFPKSYFISMHNKYPDTISKQPIIHIEIRAISGEYIGILTVKVHLNLPPQEIINR